MPVFAAVGAGLAAIGGGSAVAGAALASTAIGGVVSAIGAAKGASAVRDAGQLTYQATQDQIALDRETRDLIRQDNQPWHDTGQAALGAVSNAFGLPSAAPSMTASRPSTPSYGSTPVPGYGGVSMTAPSTGYGTRAIELPSSKAPTKTYGGPAGTSPMETAPGGQPDWKAYLQVHPDVAQAYTAWAKPGETQEQFAQRHYQEFGPQGTVQHNNLALPLTAATPPTPTTTPGGPAPGYTDPTAPGGYSVGARPMTGPGPAAYVAPALDISGYHESPGYKFAVSEAQKAINNQASGMGQVLSGQRLKALGDRAVGMANQDYTDWRNYTTNQYNVDRGFNYGQARDARGDFVTDRSRTDGLFADDRANTNARYDTRNNQLMTLAGFGANANAANANAAQTFAQNAGNAMVTGANAKGDAAIAGANAWSGFGNNLMTTGAYLLGRKK